MEFGATEFQPSLHYQVLMIPQFRFLLVYACENKLPIVGISILDYFPLASDEFD
jgi:hypothetical protein